MSSVIKENLKKHNIKFLGWVLLHMVLAIGAAASGSFAFAWGILAIVVGAIRILTLSNENNEAAKWAAYVVGMEVLLRMTDASMSFEAGKYSVIFLLTLGLLSEKTKNSFNAVLLFLPLLLIPSVFFTEVKPSEWTRAVLFNLSGPICLVFCLFYFYKRGVSKDALCAILRFLSLPIFSTAVLLQLITPDLSSIQFAGESNFETSGGFGPNQVSTILGCGIFCVFLLYMLGQTFSGFYFLDFMVALFFVFRGVMTFSRGGMISVLVTILFFSSIVFICKRRFRWKLTKTLIMIVPVSLYLWFSVMTLTDGIVRNRYLGYSADGKTKEDLFSGRSHIFLNDFSLFQEYPFFGVGVGMSKFIREDRFGYYAASHSELGRLLAEHGTLGLLFLIFLGVLIVSHFSESSLTVRIWAMTVLLYAFLTINHSAMRTALPGLLVALAFVCPQCKFRKLELGCFQEVK